MNLQEKIIIEIWEKIADQHALESALIILNSVMPSMPKKDFAKMSIGRRNHLLFHIRNKLIGRDLNCFTICPNCNVELEFSISSEEIKNPQTEAEIFFVFIIEDFTIRYRLPNSIDLAAASKCKDFSSAKREILNQCLVELTKNERRISTSDLPEEITMELSNDMLLKEPSAESVIDLVCNNCKHSWTALMDIVSFLITEIKFYANNILKDVHQLASAYGWGEAEIFEMSTQRRNWYLNTIGT